MNRTVPLDAVLSVFAAIDIPDGDDIVEVTFTASPYGPGQPSRVGTITVLRQSTTGIENDLWVLTREDIAIVAPHPFEDAVANEEDKALLYS